MDFKNLFKNKKEAFLYIILLLIILINIYRFHVAYNKYFDEDELRQVHLGWLVKEDYTLYKDTLYEHTPLLIYLISFIIKITGELTSVLTALRILTYFVSLLVLFFIYKTTKITYGKTAALIAVLFLSFVSITLGNGTEIRSVEIRPEIWANLLFWSGLYFLVTAFKDGNNLKYALSGFLFGIGLLFTSKILFIVIPLAIPLTYKLIKDKDSIKNVFYFLIPMSIPILIFLISLINNIGLVGALALLKFSLETTKSNLNVFDHFIGNVRFNLVIWILALISSLFIVYKTIKEKNIVENIFGILSVTELVMFIVFINIAKYNGIFEHSYIPFLPFVSILAAIPITELKNKLGNEINKEPFNSIIIILLIIGIITAMFSLGTFDSKKQINRYLLNIWDNNEQQIKDINTMHSFIDKNDRVYGGNGIVLFRKDTEPYFWYYSSLMKSRMDPIFKADKGNIYLNETRLIILDGEIKNDKTIELINKAFVQVLTAFRKPIFIPGRQIQIDKSIDTSFYIEYDDYYRLFFTGKEEDIKKIKSIVIDERYITNANEKMLLSKGNHKLGVISEEMKETVKIIMAYYPTTD